MILRETKELGKTEKLVSLIRKLDPGIEISTAAKFYDVDENFIIKIQNLISSNPEMDDEEIAELWMRL